MGKKAFMDKRKLFSSSLNLDLRKRIIKCFVWTVALHAAETWTLTKADKKRLESLRSLDLEKNAKDQLEGQSNKCICSRKSKGRKKHVEYNLATKTHMVGACL